MSDQAQTLRRLMASAVTATEGSPSALIEPSLDTNVDTLAFADTADEVDSRTDDLRADDFHVTADLPIVDEAAFADLTTAELCALGDETKEECRDDSRQSNDLSSADGECVTEEKQANRRIALVVGGRRGVGTTTLASQLALAMNGLAGEVAFQSIDECSEGVSRSATCRGKDDSEDITDWMVVDGGAKLTPQLEQLWRSADSVTVVTTTDASSVIGSYRMMKSAVARGLSLDAVGLIVNQVLNEHDAQRTGRRIRRCCEQFLHHCHREPQWIAFDSARCNDATACSVLHVSDDELSKPANRNIKNWADRVWSLPQIEMESD